MTEAVAVERECNGITQGSYSTIKLENPGGK